MSKSEPNLNVGDRVEILMGTFQGCRGTVVEERRPRCVTVKLDHNAGDFIVYGANYLTPLNALDRLAEET